MFFLNPVMGHQLPVHQSLLSESPVLVGALQGQKGLLHFSEVLLQCTDQITESFAGTAGNSAILHPR